jgi:hypothetical protein
MTGITATAVVIALALIGAAGPAVAQQRGQVFVYGGTMTFPSAGSSSPALASFGGGVDALTATGAGGTLEAGLLGLGGLWVPQLSANATYEKRLRRAGVRPFVSGGLSLFGGGQAINFGGGVNVWGRGRAALRLDVRDYVMPAAGGRQAIAFRVGVTYR